MDIIACPDIYNHMYIIYIYTSEATKLQISPVLGIGELQTTD